ncbi:unnamed protein product [Diplocarpon coronariae]|uniref:Uncharacterized protein n=1 Tax=Diplocarpon coronariae TaxID=2795749 RepID=A0A218Z2N6_9HELO|nr:hypothetical protein B2J93_1281 [Marssonina coronariae]
MLLQKTGLRIKRFISHKKNTSLEKYSSTSDDERYADRKLASSNACRLSWLSQTSSAETPQIRRAASNVTTRSNRLTPPSMSAHSSASSLCSCDCEANPVPIEHSLFSVEPTTPRPEILYLPPLSDEIADGEAKLWHLIFQEPLSQPIIPSELKFGPRATSAAEYGLESPFDVLGIFTIDLLDDDKTPAQSPRLTRESEIEEMSENLEQLIRETDEAFQAVGTALASAKAATRGLVDLDSSGITNSSSVLRGPMKRNPRSLTSPLKSPARAISVSKKKKRAGKRKATLFGRSLKKTPRPPTNTPARWTLTDVTTNMVDVFSGKMFRMEVDEMLTPGRIQKMKDKAESNRKISLESARSFETDSSTPKEPFHLESLSSRITAAQQQCPPFPSPVLPPHAMPRKSPLSSAPSMSPNTATDMHEENTLPYKDSMVFSDYSFSSLPPPVPPRAVHRSSAPRATTMLPTIPEVSPLNLTPTQFCLSTSSTDSSRPSLSIIPPPAQIFLPSTNFTLTSPLFRHGPIRLDRLVRNRKGSSPEEEALDWIAFQMAISGTIFDNKADLRDDAEWEADEAEIDDIIEWYASFGFQGYGRIESEVDVREREEAALVSKPVVVEERLPEISYQQKRSWRGWSSPPPPLFPPSPSLPCQCINHNSGQRMTGWKNELNIDTPARPKIAHPNYNASPPAGVSSLSIQPATIRRPSLAESLQSLPPSPMLNIVVSDSVQDDEVPIPMGFNLGHDLGDFLNWEARHAQSLYVAKESH